MKLKNCFNDCIRFLWNIYIPLLLLDATIDEMLYRKSYCPQRECKAKGPCPEGIDGTNHSGNRLLGEPAHSAVGNSSEGNHPLRYTLSFPVYQLFISQKGFYISNLLLLFKLSWTRFETFGENVRDYFAINLFRDSSYRFTTNDPFNV